MFYLVHNKNRVYPTSFFKSAWKHNKTWKVISFLHSALSKTIRSITFIGSRFFLQPLIQENWSPPLPLVLPVTSGTHLHFFVRYDHSILVYFPLLIFLFSNKFRVGMVLQRRDRESTPRTVVPKNQLNLSLRSRSSAHLVLHVFEISPFSR